MLLPQFDFSAPTTLHPSDLSNQIRTDSEFMAMYPTQLPGVQSIQPRSTPAHTVPVLSRSVTVVSKPVAGVVPRIGFLNYDTQRNTGCPVKKIKLSHTPSKTLDLRPPAAGYYQRSDGTMFYKEGTGRIKEQSLF